MKLREAYRRGINPWKTFRSYVEYLNEPLLRFEHIDTLISAAEQVESGAIKRLLVLLPPRYFKTEVFGRLLCSYHLRNHPHHSVGLASYNANKAWETSEQARTYFESSGGVLRSSAEAKRYWGPPQGGEFWAVGVAEGTIGRGYHLGVTDDVMSPEQVRSLVYQQRFQRWWSEKWRKRAEPGARLVMVMQRLGVDDPIDWLFRREVGENTEAVPENWHVLVMDEIKSEEPLARWDGPRGLPPTCTLIEDDRKTGELLAPSRFGIEEVTKAHQDVVTASAQAQQRPMRPTGVFWRKLWFRTYDELPKNAYNRGRDWDTAYGGNEENSATAYVDSARGPGRDGEFPIYIEDVGWDWREFPGLVAWMMELPGPHFVEQKATGKSVVQSLAAYDIAATEVPVKGDKLARSSAAQPTVANQRVYVNSRVVTQLLFGEGQGLLRVTAEALQADRAGDVNDAFVQAIHRHVGIGAEKKLKVAFR